MYDQSKEVEIFLKEIETVCRKHNMIITYGSKELIIETINDYRLSNLMQAHDFTDDTQADRYADESTNYDVNDLLEKGY